MATTLKLQDIERLFKGPYDKTSVQTTAQRLAYLGTPTCHKGQSIVDADENKLYIVAKNETEYIEIGSSPEPPEYHTVKSLANVKEQVFKGAIKDIQLLFSPSEITSIDVTIRAANGTPDTATVHQNTTDGITFVNIGTPTSTLETQANLKASADVWYIVFTCYGIGATEVQFGISSKKY